MIQVLVDLRFKSFLDYGTYLTNYKRNILQLDKYIIVSFLSTQLYCSALIVNNIYNINNNNNNNIIIIYAINNNNLCIIIYVQFMYDLCIIIIYVCN